MLACLQLVVQECRGSFGECGTALRALVDEHVHDPVGHPLGTRRFGVAVGDQECVEPARFGSPGPPGPAPRSRDAASQPRDELVVALAPQAFLLHNAWTESVWSSAAATWPAGVPGCPAVTPGSRGWERSWPPSRQALPWSGIPSAELEGERGPPPRMRRNRNDQPPLPAPEKVYVVESVDGPGGVFHQRILTGLAVTTWTPMRLRSRSPPGRSIAVACGHRSPQSAARVARRSQRGRLSTAT